MGLKRQHVVLAHRYMGLVMAGFLLVIGLTGSLLAWKDAMEDLVNPDLFLVRAPSSGAAALDPLELRETLLAQFPHASMQAVPLAFRPGHSISFFISDANAPDADDQIFLDPYTGKILGHRKWGDITQGWKNLMPFVYRLHFSLALGGVGSYVTGVIALIWTIDCFVGAYLTFPLPRNGTSGTPGKCTSWLRRWWPAWKIRRQGNPHKLSMDLHRAGGLWPWALLAVLAWSSVALNLTEVYDPVMRTMLSRQKGAETLASLPVERSNPRLNWQEARARGREILTREATAQGLGTIEEKSLGYSPALGVYLYQVRSSRDIELAGGETQLYFDGDTGEIRLLWLPTGAASGDTVRSWLTGLHTASVLGSLWKIVVSFMGIAVVTLSTTGLLIWVKKRKARLASMARST